MPWQNCTAIRQGIHCWELFKNGECNEACNNEACLYDGFDCKSQIKECNPFYNLYCENHFANNHCDKGCDTAECGWDGLDCDTDKELVADGTLVIIVEMEPEAFKNVSVQFVRSLGHLLQTAVKIKKDANGNDMIYPWPDTSKITRVRRYVEDMFILSRTRRAESLKKGSKVYLEIDNRKCVKDKDKECFDNTDNAAQFIVAALKQGAYESKVKIYGVESEGTRGPPGEQTQQLVYYVVAAVGFIVIIVLIVAGVLVTKARKRANGITWFPEGFSRKGSGGRSVAKVNRTMRNVPDGQEMK